jgi:hypothetical protein
VPTKSMVSLFSLLRLCDESVAGPRAWKANQYSKRIEARPRDVTPSPLSGVLLCMNGHPTMPQSAFFRDQIDKTDALRPESHSVPTHIGPYFRWPKRDMRPVSLRPVTLILLHDLFSSDSHYTALPINGRSWAYASPFSSSPSSLRNS